MNTDRIESLIATYRDGLLNDTLPFWIEHGVDQQFGGVMTSLDQDGTIVDTDNPLYESSNEDRRTDFAVRYSHYVGDFDIGQVGR